MKRSIILIIAALALAACGGLAGEPEVIGQIPAPENENAAADVPIAIPDTIDLEAGAAIYAEKCADCHGITGLGDGAMLDGSPIDNMPDLTDINNLTVQNPIDYYTVITEGRMDKFMPPFRSLSDDERWAVAMYAFGFASSGVSTVTSADVPDADDTDAVDAAAADDTAPEIDPADPHAGIPGFGSEAASEAAALEEVSGIVRGTLTNGTAGATIRDELDIVLHMVDGSFQEETMETTINADGTYTFDDVPMRMDRGYYVTVLYGGGQFVSDILGGTPEDPELVLDLELFETTDDDSVIEIQSAMMQVDRGAGGIQVIERFDLINNTDRMYTRPYDGGQGNVSVGFELPEDAVFVPEQNDMRRLILSSDQRTVYDMQTVLPEEPHTVIFAYLIPHSETPRITHPLAYNFEGHFQVFANDAAYRVTNSTMQAIGQEQTDSGSTYTAYMTNLNITPGQALTLELRAVGGSTIPTDTTSNPQTVNVPLVLGLAVAGLGMFSLAGVLYARGRNVAPTAPPQEEINSIIKQIADLDEQHELGNLDEAAYTQQRDALKARLSALMQAET